MNKTVKRHKTEQSIDRQLDKMFFLAAEQKLLPQLIYDYSSHNNSAKHVNMYRESVKEIYTKNTAKLLKYNEDDAKTHRQKFREKIIKLLNNQLPIDYLKPIKVNGKNVMTYRGEPLEKVQYPTKQEYKIFNGYTQSKFNREYEDLFDDKLEYKHQKLFNSLRRSGSNRMRTSQQNAQQISNNNKVSVTQPSQAIIKEVSPQMSLPKLIARVQFDKSKMQPPSSPKKRIKKLKTVDESLEILNTMKKIGGYNINSTTQIRITKESILKYFKQNYTRPHRIIDFLQFQEVQSFPSFSRFPLKMKLMPIEHVYFMTFLFYDTNNDGYICNNDIIRVEELAKKNPLLQEDCHILRTGANKIKYENEIVYKELYRLSEITETTFFNWLKKQKPIVESQNPQIEGELKNYFGHLNKRNILIHYQGFKKIFAGEKPFLWYDVLQKVSGFKYEGLKYR